MSIPWWLLGKERRSGDRRQGERRSPERSGPGRRQHDRRAAARAVLISTLVAVAAPGAATADVFTRRGPGGVLEATNLPDGGEGYRLAYRSKGPVVHSPGFRIRPSNNRLYDAYIQEAVSLHGVDEALVRAVIQVESEFDPRAVSRAGARGLMQIMPATAVRLGVSDPFDPRQNILGGVKYLRMLLKMFNGDVSLAAAGYNAGEHAVQRYNGVPPYKETQGYVRKVLGLLARGFSGGPATAFAAGAPVQAPAAKLKATVIYKWRDTQGRLFLSDTPPAGATPFVVVTRMGD